jgi:chemotaxis protein histidine kinase CheA
MDLGQVFYVESLEMLDEIISDLIMAESGDIPEDFVGRLFRTYHTVKGGAAMLGFVQLEKLAHRLEDTLDEMRAAQQVPHGNQLTIIIDITYLIQEMITAQQNQSPEDYSQRAERLIKLLEEGAQLDPPSGGAKIAVSKIVLQKTAEKQVEPVTGTVEEISERPIFLVSCRINDDAPMPEVTSMLLRRNLAERGDILFASEDSPAAKWLNQDIIYLVATDAGALGLRNAVLVTDVELEKVTPVKGKALALLNTKQLGEEATTSFNQLIIRMMQSLCGRGIEHREILKAVGVLKIWFQQHGEQLGSRNQQDKRWEKNLDLLEADIRLSEALSETAVAKLIITNCINGLWNQVFYALCDRFYYFAVRLSDVSEINSLDEAITRMFASGEFVHGIVDVSHVSALELEDEMQQVRSLFTKWEGQGKHLSLVAQGENFPKHEILSLALPGDFPGGKIYRNEFEAFLGVEGE